MRLPLVFLTLDIPNHAGEIENSHVTPNQIIRHEFKINLRCGIYGNNILETYELPIHLSGYSYLHFGHMVTHIFISKSENTNFYPTSSIIIFRLAKTSVICSCVATKFKILKE